MSIDEGYASGEAMLLLAYSYAGRGEQDQANLLYQKGYAYVLRISFSFVP